ncbi:ArsR/SmtB family transcription factor [Rhizobium sp. HT1-10]|uniref:ArsR/SmtB family transcription factor n=1 Tax=Rhizobium sp. HT1-10 TaxID=3111638 RepID=UPI003C2C2742
MGKTKGQSGDGFREGATLLHHLQNRNRLRVIEELRKGEVKVSDLAEALGVSPSAVSHQLKKLRWAKLVTTRRDGTNIYYSCSSSEVCAVLDLLADIFEAR